MTGRFPIIDLHVHSVHSDGSLTVPEILEIAGRKGYAVGISDHASPEDKIIHDAHVVAYLDALEEYSVYRALEMDAELGADISANCLARLDYVIVGIHFLTLGGIQTFFWDPLAAITDSEAFLDAYVVLAERAMASMAMDILAHPTLLPLGLREDAGRLWTPSRIKRFVAAAVRHHVALEISGHWRVPSEEMIAEGLRQGATFALGSDGHGPDSMCDLEYPLAMLRQFGIGPHQLFQPKRRLPAAA